MYRTVKHLKTVLSQPELKFRYVRRCSSLTNKSSSLYQRISTVPKLKNDFLTYGQPTPATHPHLLANGEIVPKISVDELQNRRQKLMDKILKYSHETKKNYKTHIVIIPSATKQYMSDKIPYVFRQNSDFFYFTGCLEPDSLLIITSNEKQETKSILFMRPKDKHAELWDGPRTGVEISTTFFGVDEAYSVKDLPLFLSSFLKLQPSLACWYDSKTTQQKEITNILSTLLHGETNIPTESPTRFFHQLRVIKSEAEIELMKIACDIGSKSLNQVINESQPGDSEHHLFARVDFHARMKNASHLAYPPVVAGGNNATTIHYINNTQIINDGEMVLMDAGCEYGGYSSDITRTWPINGKFTPEQKILYEIVLNVQKELIDVIGDQGRSNLDELFNTMCLKLGKYLQEIGLISRSVSKAELAKIAYSFCPHHVSHYLGMDVHDTPLISRNSALLPGMICTVEPGIYISVDRNDIPREFRGIGLRIEDDVLIRETFVEVLTKECVKEINEIESLIQK